MGVFVPDPTFEKAALRAPEVREKLLELAEEGADRARDLAPDDPSTGPDEDLAGSIVGEVLLTPDGFRGRVIARNYKGLFFEAGTIDNAPRPFLRPALEQMGLEVGDEELEP